MSEAERCIQRLQVLQEAMRIDKKLGRLKVDGSFLENRLEIIDDAIELIGRLSSDSDERRSK